MKIIGTKETIKNTNNDDVKWSLGGNTSQKFLGVTIKNQQQASNQSKNPQPQTTKTEKR